MKILQVDNRHIGEVNQSLKNNQYGGEFLDFIHSLSPDGDSRVGQVAELWTRTIKTRRNSFFSFRTGEVDSCKLQSMKRISLSPPFFPLLALPWSQLQRKAELPLWQWWWWHSHLKIPKNSLSLPRDWKPGPLWSKDGEEFPLYILIFLLLYLWTSQPI